MLLGLVGSLSTKAALDTQRYQFINWAKNHITSEDSTALSGFHEKLLAFTKDRKEKVKILQIGDSHVQSGMLGSETEEVLKNHYADTNWNNGFIFPYALARTFCQTDYEVTDKWGDWKRCRNVFRHLQCGWGLSGYVASTTSSQAGFTLKTRDEAPFTHVRIYHDTLGENTLQVLPKNGIVVKVEYGGNGLYTEFILSKPVHEMSLHIEAKGEFKMRGLWLDNGSPGIMFNDIGVNGAEVPSFLYSPFLGWEIAQVAPDLIILSLGVNDTYSSAYDADRFHRQYDSLLALLRRNAPDADILLTTPGDCKRFRRYVNKGNVSARAAIFELAAKYHCAVWDWFSIMGGLGSIEDWYSAGLANRDKLHLVSKGYNLQGGLLAHALIEHHEWFMQHQSDSHFSPSEEKEWDGILKWFSYNDKHPLLFSSLFFLFLFTLFYAIYSSIHTKINVRNIYLMLFSLYFYYLAGGYYFVLLIVSTFIDYFIGHQVFLAKSKKTKKGWVAASVVANLGLLGFFKYSYLVVDGINTMLGTQFEAVNWVAHFANVLADGNYDTATILLPVGISFYTFQTISYTVDIYRKKIKPLERITDFAFYVSFFPQLVAGPIVRAADFVPQIRQQFSLSKADFGRAITLIVLGLIKKSVVSDYISVNYVDRVFDNPQNYSGFENLLAAYGYNIQIFCDFSGYSDMAIGLALLLGFRLPINFNAPFRSLDITDFWRRWHMSLSSWLRDYLYIPLGGNRKGVVRTYVNLFLTMLLGGLWHGANLRFIVWGAAHGVALAAHKLMMHILGNPKQLPWWRRAGAWLLTFHFVVVTFMLFRAPTFERFWFMLKRIGTDIQWSHAPSILLGYKEVLSVMLLGYLIHFIPDALEVKLHRAWVKMRWVGVSFSFAVIILLVYQFRSAGVQPFIYFQF